MRAVKAMDTQPINLTEQREVVNALEAAGFKALFDVLYVMRNLYPFAGALVGCMAVVTL